MQLRALLILVLAACARPVPPANPPATLPKPAAQNPSPMVEHVRPHDRVAKRPLRSGVMTVEGVLPKPVEILNVRSSVNSADGEDATDVLIHFHGASWLPMQAAEDAAVDLTVAVVNIGAGGGAYEKAFSDPAVFPRLLDEIRARSGKRFGAIRLSAFSAGYGAVRAILRNHYDLIDGVLLLDGLHTSYVPERKPIAEGGILDVEKLESFRRLAADAVAGRKRFVLTHSEIFPGTFASTTETADHILESLSLRRRAVLQWGPLGMQQVGEARSGRFHLLSFAGNSAPDHIDHLHAIVALLPMLLQ